MFNKKLISIITPVLNEEKTLHVYYDRVTRVIDKMHGYDFEIIFTDNASTDNTFNIIQELAHQDKRIRAFKLSKNFGYQRSVFTGFQYAKGDAAIELDCDLQDPPELLVEFVQAWEKGNKIVYGVRSKRKESWLLTSLRKIFYRLLNAVSEDDIPVDAGDFMLIDRDVIDQLIQIHDQHIYIRGVIFSLGFRRQPIIYARDARLDGDSKFNFTRLVSLAVDGFIGHSILPLRISLFLGIIIAFFMLVLSAAYIILYIVDQELPSGFTTTTLLILFSISLNGLFLGIIGEYLARVYQQTRNRPMSIIEQKIDK